MAEVTHPSPASSKHSDKHFVRFYKDDSLLLDEVTPFIDAALAGGGAGIVIATAGHLSALRDRLAVIQAARGTVHLPGRLVTRDATEALAGFMLDDWPDAALFDDTIGQLVRDLAEDSAPIHAFGEMVAILSGNGNYNAAIRLEELWNELAQRCRFTLFCAYPWSQFPNAELAETFRHVCALHDHAAPCAAEAAASPEDTQQRLLVLEQQARSLSAEIARRGAAESALAQRERELAHFIENAAEGIHQVGADGTILWANRAELRMLGYRWEEYIGHHIAEFHADPAVIETILARLKAGDTLCDVPVRLRCKDGAIKHALINSNGHFEQGVLRHTRCFTRDATERYQRDEALAQRDRVLMEAPVGTALLLGEDFVFHLANRQFCDMTLRAGLEGTRFGDAFPELAGGEIGRQLRAVYATGQPFTASELGVDLVRDGVSEMHYFQVGLQALPAVDGDTQGVIMVLVDVGEHVRCRREVEAAHAQREVLVAELAAASRAKDEFLAMLGHELRNPLSPILTALEVMRLQGERSPAQDVIERQLAHMVRLIDDLLDISRVTNGNIVLQTEALELGKIFDKAVEMVSPLIAQRQHRFSMEVQPSLAVCGDQVRLVQIVGNLLTNAARYTPIGGDIRLTASGDQDSVYIAVRDNGIGISPDALAHVFDLFYQDRRNADRSAGGLGIGLALVDNLVRLHGGSIAAHSGGPGQGSEFLVRLPRLAHQSDTAPAHDEALGAAVDAADTPAGKRILLVDDNTDAVSLMAELLELYGHQVQVFNEPLAALEDIEQFQPQIAILDIGLPTMNGYALAESIRDRLAGRQCRLFALTGYGQSLDRERASAAGFEQHLIKPVHVEKIIDLIMSEEPVPG
jgi:PAS domain S-box-containing protein